MKKVLLKSMLLFVAVLFAGISTAQTVSGTVTEESGPLPGANVIVKGTQNGVTTDFDGNYTLNNVASDAILIFSYVGFATQEIAVNGQTTVNVTLAPDNALDEVVLIGYGSTTIKDATGTVAVVTSEEFNSGVIASPEQLIQGKTSGVAISETSGEPGAAINFNIRGVNSIRSGNDPLFVVDGIPLGGGGPPTAQVGGIGGSAQRNPLSFLNPNDIESISILKDASSTAIYGARAANGVVIIQTKAGRTARKGVWELNSSVSVGTVANEYDLLTASEFIQAREDLGLPAALNGGGNGDYQDFALRTAYSRRTDLSYAKNWGSGNIRSSFTYSNQNGLVEQAAQERIAGRVNLSQKFLDDKLTVDFQGTISRVNDSQAPLSGGAGSVGDFLSSSLTTNPTFPIDPDATFGFENRFNPPNLLENFKSLANSNRYLANISVGYDFTSEFSAKVFASYDYGDSQIISAFAPNVFGVNNISGVGDVQFNSVENENTQLDLTLNYKKDFDSWGIDVIGGYSYQKFDRNGFFSQGRGLTTNNLDNIFGIVEQQFDLVSNAIGRDFQQFGYDNDSASVGFNNFNDPENPFLFEDLPAFQRLITAYTANTFDNFDEFQSVFVRANLSFANNKFLLTATGRLDGSTLFGEDEKSAFFPSGAFAWNLHEEDFTGDNVSTLKIRLGVGITGNSQGLTFGNAILRQQISGQGFAGPTDLNPPGGTQFIGNNDPGLKFEETTDFNVGVDFGFNQDRFNGSFNVYRKETRDLLLQRAVPAPGFGGIPTVFGNLDNGVLINQGVELALAYDFVQTDDWNFSASFNIAYNDNVLEDYTDAPQDLAPINGNGLTNAFAQRLDNNQPLSSFFLARFEGFDGDGNPIFADLNGDGVGDPVTDREFSDRSAIPTLTGGLSLNASYKNWSLSTFFNYQGGFYVYNATNNALFSAGNFLQQQNVTQETIQSLLNGENIGASTTVSDRFLEKGDFVRLQNATLSYDWPLSGDGVLDGLRLSFTGQNLFLITDYSGLDPEVSTNTGFLNAAQIPARGIDLAQTPRPRTFTLGVNARF
ncbi:SusC/RagA family TonB-linked outer membrane protein [uncultured Dokdonia sp.]|uniref:SusC/RagA family TonB-linked outer membrane protein n=1 Tax=uncultured Dokdonia sp. TaxID=575653 RepID=UPI00262C805D|nr:SusC/RagA family TonB-linked outer membrane protein [uncultured Dokdonia sp.]